MVDGGYSRRTFVGNLLLFGILGLIFMPLEGGNLLTALRQDDWQRGTRMYREHTNYRACRDGDQREADH